MYIWLSPTPPPLHVGHLPDPLVGHHLPAEYDGTAAVQHGHVAPAVLVQVVPQHGAPQLRPENIRLDEDIKQGSPLLT